MNKYMMGLQNPMILSAKRYKISLRARNKLIVAVTCESEFSTADHILSVKEEQHGGKKY